MNSNEEKRIHFTMSHLGIIRLFVLWGILESLVFLLTKGDRLKSMSIYLGIFFVITIAAIYSPSIIDYL
jgi:hypothetical protein